MASAVGKIWFGAGAGAGAALAAVAGDAEWGRKALRKPGSR